MLLTGYSEIDNAIAAINEGGIFRFLTKPTSPEVLQTAVSEGIRQWELVRSEKVLLEQTVRGSSESLIEALEIASPVAFSRSRRLESACRHVAQELRFDPVWPVTLAGLFLRLGWIAIPTEVIEARLAGEPSEANSREMFDEAIATSVRLVGRIPRLGVVAEIIAATAAPSGWLDGPTVVAAVSDFDDLSVLGRSPAEAIQPLWEE
jgi:response regulator RpfG family c-di-GMP phosphodiesterase